MWVICCISEDLWLLCCGCCYAFGVGLALFVDVIWICLGLWCFVICGLAVLWVAFFWILVCCSFDSFGVLTLFCGVLFDIFRMVLRVVLTVTFDLLFSLFRWLVDLLVLLLWVVVEWGFGLIACCFGFCWWIVFVRCWVCGCFELVLDRL